ncbi:MAG: arginine deiminase [Eubacteriales bacterium]|nr:arginine deiminase [Eubacteriales bacterium]
MSKAKLHVYSEIDKLNAVLLHKPGLELENLTPQIMQSLLFDDIPDAIAAGREYDAFIDVFKQNGTEVFFLEDFVVECLRDRGIREVFIREFLYESALNEQQIEDLGAELSRLEPEALVQRLICGLRKEEVNGARAQLYAEHRGLDYPLILDPLPNLYFTRDPFTIIGQGVSIHKMYSTARRRETLFSKLIFEEHPWFRNIQHYYEREYDDFLEGGDIIQLCPTALAVGISERTSRAAVEQLAQSIFTNGENIEHVLGFEIPAKRAFMHLDTVFTQIDRDLFVVHPEIEESLVVYDFQRTAKAGEFKLSERRGKLEEILEHYTGIDGIRVIRCGGNSKMDAQREQWNDGSNTLAIAPNEIIVYDRNRITNELFDKHGVKLHVIPSSEISRGRGGPRCMSMPLCRGI